MVDGLVVGIVAGFLDGLVEVLVDFFSGCFPLVGNLAGFNHYLGMLPPLVYRFTVGYVMNGGSIWIWLVATN